MMLKDFGQHFKNRDRIVLVGVDWNIIVDYGRYREVSGSVHLAEEGSFLVTVRVQQTEKEILGLREVWGEHFTFIGRPERRTRTGNRGEIYRVLIGQFLAEENDPQTGAR